MKKRIISITLISVWAFLLVSVMTSCKKEEEKPAEEDKGIVPGTFYVEVPSSISATGSGQRNGRTDGTTSLGDEIYASMTVFIGVGEFSAKFVSDLITIISVYRLSQPITFSYTSDEDGRLKKVVIVEDGVYEGETFEYKMTITDSLLGDTAKALQVYWNRGPIKGVALLKPYHANKNDTGVSSKTMYRVDYNETPLNGYDKQMTVYISGIPVRKDGDIDNLKMWVGKSGSIISVVGNSNHPQVYLDTNINLGSINYAFVAKSDEFLNLATAKLGLPPSSETTTANIFTTYSVYNVLYDGLFDKYEPVYGTPAMTTFLPPLLTDANAPGYFNNTGFIASGTAPAGITFPTNVTDLNGLSPFVPNDVKNQTIQFGN